MGAFALLAILYAGTKPERKSSYNNGKSARVRQSDISTPLRFLPDKFENETNLFTITAFNVSSSDETLSFEMSWQTNLFDFTDSRNVYLFMSTNLIEKKWVPLGLYEMPLATNATSILITDRDVVNSMKQNFRDAFYNRGFFFFNLDFDSDNDRLADAIEKYFTLTDPMNADSDGDGLLDGDEISCLNANTNAVYQKNLYYMIEEKSSDEPTITQKLAKDEYLVFRTRTKVDEKGNLISAHYGKIYGELALGKNGDVRIDFFAFNPIPNDTNLEDSFTSDAIIKQRKHDRKKLTKRN